MNRLVYEHEGKAVEVALGDSPVTLGRGGKADHKLPTRKASRIHARVFPRDGCWWVEDLESSNGTGVNGRKVKGEKRLAPGDVVNVGDIALTFEGEQAEEAPREATIARVVYDPGDGRSPVETPIHDRITIGRKPDNTLQIEHKAVSGVHCEVIRLDGECVLRDLDSSNGTWVNGKRANERTLRDGDVLLLGRKVELKFSDPSAKPEPEKPAPSSADGASDRGKFKPVGLPAPSKLSKLPVPVATGLVLGVLFALGGWLLGGVIVDMREAREATGEAEREPEPVQEDTAFSFEGAIDETGDPEGWNASFESKGDTQVELASDRDDPWDGHSCLRVRNISPGVPGTLVLQTVEAREFDLGGAFEAGIYLKGESAGRVAVALSLVDEGTGRVTTIAADSFVGLKDAEWRRFRMKGVPQTRLPKEPQLRLMISAGFSRLWVDRLEIRSTRDDPKPGPLAQVQAPGLTVELDERRPSEVVVSNDAGDEVRFQPVLLDFEDDRISEGGLWSVSEADSSSLRYTAMMPPLNAATDVTLRAQEWGNAYLDDPGLRLDWESGGGAASLAVDVTLPFPAGAELAVADRRGMPLVVDKHAVHAYPYSTISELMVNETDLAVSFPDGAVVWLDFTQPGVLVATVRAPLESARKSFSVTVNARPLMFARLYQRMLDEAARLMDADHYSAAKVRLEYLTSPSRPDADLPVIDRARGMLDEIEEHRLEVESLVTRAWDGLNEQRTLETVRDTRELVLRYLREFPGEDSDDLMKKLGQLDDWIAELERRQRTPEEMQEAIRNAKALLDAAEKSRAGGNILMALVMLESVLQDYAHTPQVHQAQNLHDEISEQMNNPAQRDLIIDKELEGIDEDISYEDYERARRRCLRLFRRFPDTERNRDIMKRLRVIESAYED